MEWLEEAVHCPSPNFSERSDINTINLLVIHSISLPPGKYGNHFIDDLFCNRLDPNADPYFKELSKLQVSAHLLIRRTGEVTQYVNFLKKAWHAGESSFQGQENCNDFSIGIELEGLEGELFETQQYQSLTKLTNTLMAQFPKITQDRICAHSDIAPGRKQDPGAGFDWSRFLQSLDR